MSAEQPRITAPVSRYIGTTNQDRAISYWRDVLGFEVRGSAADEASQRGEPVDLVSGQARIRIGARDWSPDFSDAREPGAAILFFETNDLDAMHAAIRRRSGQPTELEKVNWIKMRVTVLLIARTPRHGGIGSAYVYVRDADALYSELIAKGADVQGEPISQPWGLREFSVLDLERNRLTFGQPFE